MRCSTGGDTDDAGEAAVCTDVSGRSAGGELLPPLNANPHVAPQFVALSSSGDQVTFDFSGSAAIQIGDSNESFVLVIKTNRKSFTAGSSSIIDGGVANVASFAPTPEPAFAGLLLGGLFVVGLFLARRFQVRQS